MRNTRAAKGSALTWLGALGLLNACALLALVLAWWGWRWLGPSPLPLMPPAPQNPALALQASGLFAAPAGTPTAVDTTVRTGSADMRLLGVLAEDGDKGFALFRLPGGPKLVAAGRDIAEGTRLLSVQRDGVTVRDGDGERRMLLRAGALTPPPKAVSKSASKTAACVSPPGFRGDVLRLNAELVGGIVTQPETWNALLTVESGALTVRDDSGFSAMLAMKKGDRIEQANGIALRTTDDIIAAVLRPLTAGQSVRVTGTRAGAPREWLLQNAGTCS